MTVFCGWKPGQLSMNVKILATTTMVLAVFAGAMTAVAGIASAEESPLTCGYDGQLTISCDVYADVARIDDITVNRGRCQSPQVLKAIRFYLDQNASPIDAGELSDAERDAFAAVTPADVDAALAAVAAKGLVSPEMEAMGLAPLALLEPMLNARAEGDLPTAVELALAIFAASDPTWNRPDYAFGDTLTFRINGCTNLLEYSITVNGAEWVWNAKDTAE